jgi:hypothetical protein
MTCGTKTTWRAKRLPKPHVDMEMRSKKVKILHSLCFAPAQVQGVEKVNKRSVGRDRRLWNRGTTRRGRALRK